MYARIPPMYMNTHICTIYLNTYVILGCQEAQQVADINSELHIQTKINNTQNSKRQKLNLLHQTQKMLMAPYTT